MYLCGTEKGCWMLSQDLVGSTRCELVDVGRRKMFE